MSSFITAAGEDYLLDLITTAGSVLPSYFVAIARTAPPTRHMSGSELDEPTSVDYTRAPYINTSGRWSNSAGSRTNSEAVIFPVCTTEWGVVRHWAICSSDIGGEVLWAGSFTVPVTIMPADQLVIEPGALTISTIGYATSVML